MNYKKENNIMGRISWKKEFEQLDEEYVAVYHEHLKDQLRNIIITSALEEDDYKKLENMALFVASFHGKRLINTVKGFDIVDKEVS